MSDILSQDEINALLGAYKSGEAITKGVNDKGSEHQIRLYDFARPDKFSKEHLRTLNTIHSKYGNGCSIVLAGLLHVPVEADLLAVDQVTYREYCASVPESTLFCDVVLEPLTTAAIFEFNPTIVGACIDGLTGGSGTSISNAADLTDIDRAIMAKVVGFVLKKYEEAWGPYISISPSVREATSNSSFNQVFLPTEPVLVCGYEVSVGDAVGMMSICIPSSAVEAILPNLTMGKSVGSSHRQTPAMIEALHNSLSDTTVGCKAILGRTTLTVEDLINLQEGDVIALDAPLNSEVEIWVGDKLAYAGVPGRAKRKLGLQVTRVLEDESPKS